MMLAPFCSLTKR